MPYLLDGNNLIGVARRTARPSEKDRSELVAELSERLRRTRARVTLFFDGPAGERPLGLGNLSVRGTRGASADAEILREIGRSANPGELVVVTADRELARRAREAGARALLPGEFWRRFGSSAPAEPRPDSAPAVDVEEWMRYFEDERNRES